MEMASTEPHSIQRERRRTANIAIVALVIGVVNMLVILGAVVFVQLVNHQMDNLVRKSAVTYTQVHVSKTKPVV